MPKVILAMLLHHPLCRYAIPSQVPLVPNIIQPELTRLSNSSAVTKSERRSSKRKPILMLNPEFA